MNLVTACNEEEQGAGRRDGTALRCSVQRGTSVAAAAAAAAAVAAAAAGEQMAG